LVSIHASPSVATAPDPPTIAILGSSAATGHLRMKIGRLDAVAHPQA
jgi:hypothetical protein